MKLTGYLSYYILRSFKNPPIKQTIRSDEGLTLETSAFQISVRWSIYINNSVDKPNFRVSLRHQRSTTVSLETNPVYSFVIKQTVNLIFRTVKCKAVLIISEDQCNKVA